MSTNPLENLERQFRAIRERLGVKKGDRAYLDFDTVSKHDAGPHVELVDGELHFVICERGTEYKRRVAKDEDELLYWLICTITRWLASDWECCNRIPDQDSRIGWMNKEIELLQTLNPSWAIRKYNEYKRLLAKGQLRDPRSNQSE